MVTAIAASLQRQDEKGNIELKLSNRAGLPKWDKAIVSSKKVSNAGKGSLGNQDFVKVVLIPFVPEGHNQTKAILTVKITAADTSYKLIYASQYAKFGFDKEQGKEWNARNIFHLFTRFDREIFGHKKFLVKDKRILSCLNADVNGIATVEMLEDNIAGRMEAITYCNSYDVCVKACPNAARPNDALAAMSMPCCLEWGSQSVCTTIWIEIGDGGGTTPPPPGGGGGGSGGGTGPIDDPCEENPARPGTSNRLEPCDEDPGWEPVPIDNDPDPCQEVLAASTKATNTSKSNAYITAKASLQAAATDGNEHNVVFGKDVNGNITASNIMSSGSTNSSPTNTSFPGAFADLHNHPGNSPPSTGDLSGLININKNKSAFDTRFTVLPNGSVYALVVINPAAANTFTTNYPSQQVPGYSPDFPDALIDEYNEVRFYANGSDEMAMAFMLAKYNMGVALLKQDSNGNFKRLNTTETINSNGTKTYTSNNCL